MFLFLIRNRVFCSSNGLIMVFGAPPGGAQDLGETPEESGVREVLEEKGFKITINRLLGVFSSLKYESVNYPWTGREYLHCFFMGEIFGGLGSPFR